MSYLSTTIQKIRYLVSRDNEHVLILQKNNGAFLKLDLDSPIARDAAITTAIDNLLSGVPGALNTLNELAAALGNDANFAATVTTALAARLQKSQNLADVADANASRVNLGLGTAATHADTDFDTPSARNSAISTALADRLQASLNLADLTDMAAAFANLGLGTAATHAATDFDTPAARDTAINTAVTNLLNGVPGALDTLNELATALGDDANFSATIATALSNRLVWKGPWAATTAYVQNDTVTYNGGLYRALTAFTSGSSFVKANWTELSPQGNVYIPYLVSLDPADTTGVANSAAMQAAINAAAPGTRIVPNSGTFPMGGASIDGKSDLIIDNPSCQLVRQSGSGLGALFVLGNTSPNTNITINLELDGNSFLTGQAIQCKQTDGFKIGSGFYAHHWRGHGVGFHTSPSANIDIADGARFEFIGIGAAADPTGFDPAFPNGVAIYFAVTCPHVRIGNVQITDVKGQAAIYINGCNDMKIVEPNIKRTGYRGIMTTTAAVRGLKIIEPTMEDIGILYEIKPAASGGHNPGDSLYGQGTNGIYIQPNALSVPEDAQVVGGSYVRCGENGIEGGGIWKHPTVIDPGYPYTGFGSGLSRVGLFVNVGTIVRSATIIRPPTFGISAFESTRAITDITIDNVYIEDPGTKGIHFQQSGTFTMSNVSITNAQVRVKTASPTHAVHVRGTSGGSLGSTVIISGTRGVGTFSTAVVQTSASSPGTNNAQTWDNTIGGAIATPLNINAQTGTTYTLALTDADSLVTSSNTAAQTITVPLNSAVAYGVGSVISIVQLNTGQVHIVGDTGVTVNATPGGYLRAQYSQATLTKIGTDTWLLAGDLSS